jgi:energy-coupling factor transport system substrate-specific component
MSRNEITMKSMMAAYALFSAIFAFSAICPIKFLQSAFVGAMEKNNIAPEYIQGMLNITSVPMLVVIVAAGLVGGLIGGFIGQKALKKHFIKAGLVSVK